MGLSVISDHCHSTAGSSATGTGQRGTALTGPRSADDSTGGPFNSQPGDDTPDFTPCASRAQTPEPDQRDDVTDPGEAGDNNASRAASPSGIAADEAEDSVKEGTYIGDEQNRFALETLGFESAHLPSDDQEDDKGTSAAGGSTK